MDDNFNFFALAYLNDWLEHHGTFVSGVSPSRDRSIRASRLAEAADDDKIIDGFQRGQCRKFSI